MEDPLGAPNTVVVASATTIIFFACLPIQLAALTKFTVFFFMFTTSLARKSEPEVVFFSRFRQRVTTSTSLARKSEPERVFFHVSPACHHLHLPRMQKRAGGGCFLVFHLHVTTTTSLARKSEPEVVFFLAFHPHVTTTTSLACKSEPEVVFLHLHRHVITYADHTRTPNTQCRG